MKLVFASILVMGISFLTACTTKNAQVISERQPQATSEGTGSIGSGGGRIQNIYIRACDRYTPTSLEYLMEKREFANGQIRVLTADTYGEPVCCSTHMIIYVTHPTEPSSKCFHVASSPDGRGFSSADLKNIKASYDPDRGLSLIVPFYFYNQGQKPEVPQKANFLINQAVQTVELQ